MNIPHSDALVFFGATGDLTYKKIFPALYAMERRGHLQVPVIGVARSDWTIEKFRAQCPRERRAVRRLRRGGLREVPGAAPLYQRRLRRPRPPTPLSGRNSAMPRTRCTILQSLRVYSRR